MPARAFTLRLDDLQAYDRRVIDVFLKFLGPSNAVCWQTVVNDPTVRADVTVRVGDPSVNEAASASPVIWVVDPVVQAPVDAFTLTRPLQLESFTSVLTRLGAVLSRSDPVRARTGAVDAVQARDDHTLTGANPQEPSSRVRATPVDAPPDPGPAREPSLAHWGGRRVKLSRWPTVSLLRSDPKGAVMASFLTREFLAPEQLATLSGLSEERCARFIEALSAQSLLRVAAIVPPDEVTTAAPVPPPAVATANADDHSSPRGVLALVSKLRARLGF